MAEPSSNAASAAAGIELSQLYQVFFKEAGENLQAMEQMLLELDLEAADDEELNAYCRCARSIKGGAATFGFSDVAQLTHQMEALMDKVRRHELKPTAQKVDVLLAAGDVLKAMLARHQGSGAELADTTGLLQTIKSLCDGGRVHSSAALSRPGEPVAAAVQTQGNPSPDGMRMLELSVGPLADPSVADSMTELFNEIPDLGQIEPLDAGRWP